MFLYESIVATVAFIFLLAAVIAIVLPEAHQHFYKKKGYLLGAGDVCSAATAIWFFSALIVPISNSLVALMFSVSAAFAYFTVRFYIVARELKA